MEQRRIILTVTGALLAGVTTAVLGSTGLDAPLAIVAGVAVAIPLLRAEAFGGFDSPESFDSGAAFLASLGALVVGTVGVYAAGAFGAGQTVTVGLGGGGAFAGSYLGDVYAQRRS
ncbi:hypothetical protein AUR64_15695 [Haloprofundus marisrubri]|uniref:Uncharacterized protein n=1 Tax=Haloprofundus marisrubri TaxID=1514971 RepID=A0A0W1R7P0_9EURY|nr:hypothetical protein [Haloprofundus marisrubri]KTG09233.1 hypothetical protein AUR64_15695 [Haloprofundus marisrubri]